MLKWDASWDMNYVSNLAGEISLVFGLILWATTFPRIRRNMFELFYYTHHLYILFILFFFLHKGPFFICIMLPGFYLFLIDRFLRFLQSRQKVCLLSARLLPCQAMELNFSKSPGEVTWPYKYSFCYRYIHICICIYNECVHVLLMQLWITPRRAPCSWIFPPYLSYSGIPLRLFPTVV